MVYDIFLFSSRRNLLFFFLILDRRNEDTASDDVIFTLQHFEFFNSRLRREFGNQYTFKKETRQIDDQYLFVEKLF